MGLIVCDTLAGRMVAISGGRVNGLENARRWLCVSRFAGQALADVRARAEKIKRPDGENSQQAA
jgi:hypothetical protein